MFQTSSWQSRFGATIYLAEWIYHASVRKVREKHGNALLSILVTIGQTALFTLAFYLMFVGFLCGRPVSVGIFSFILHRGIFVYGLYQGREGNISIREINIRNDATCTDGYNNCDLSCGDKCFFTRR